MISTGKAKTLGMQKFREEPVTFRKVLGPYLLRRSRLRCFYYAKSARGKGHRVDRVLRGMRWNYYMYYGKGTPKANPLERPKAPPVVKGIMRSYKIRRSIIFTPQELRIEKAKFRSWGETAKKVDIAGPNNHHLATLKPWNFVRREEAIIVPVRFSESISEKKTDPPPPPGKQEPTSWAPVKPLRAPLISDAPPKIDPPKQPRTEGIMS